MNKEDKKQKNKKNINTTFALGLLFFLLCFYLAFLWIEYKVEFWRFGTPTNKLLTVTDTSLVAKLKELQNYFLLLFPSLIATIISVVLFFKKQREKKYAIFFFFNVFVFVFLLTCFILNLFIIQ